MGSCCFRSWQGCQACHLFSFNFVSCALTGWAVFDEAPTMSPYSGDQAATQSVPVDIPFPGRGQRPGEPQAAAPCFQSDTSLLTHVQLLG